MDTPPKPMFGFRANQSANHGKAPNLTAKTPFQAANIHQRSFKSEFQPRASSRFCNEATNVKSSFRPIASTSQRPLIPDSNNKANSTVSSKRSIIFSKLGNLIVKQTQPRPRLPVKEEKDEEVKVEVCQEPARLCQPSTTFKTKPVAPRIATTTKAPLSVSQYTQPTPSSKTAQQMPRAHSEPSIKYQVKVNDKTYKVLRKIGTGGSAKVYEGFEPSTYQTVAIKIINVAKADPKAQESYFNEQAILMKLQDSRHVARIYNSEYKAECKELVIVMEKGDADLSQVIDSHFKLRDKMIDGIFIKFYWRGMVSAVNDIHNRGIVHADLKPVNFILVRNEIKLIDFGIADSIDPGGTSIIRDYQIGTVNYMAPEALRNRANDASFAHLHESGDENSNQVKRTIIRYNRKVDIWSLGCILYNLVYGKPPFDRYQDLISKVQAIVNPRHVIDFPQISNSNLLDCMRSCLRYNPAERPSAQDLLNHPYLNEDIVVLARQD